MVSKSKDVIELLKSDAEYYGGVGKEYLSNSDIYIKFLKRSMKVM